MAKKTESRPKEQEAVPVAQENTDATPESAAEGQEAVQEKQEPAAGTQEATPEKREPEQAATDSMMVKLEEILNDDIEPAEENPLQKNDDQQDTDPPQEKILFYVKTVNDKTAVRSTPEYPMAGSNVIDVITDRGPYGIVGVENGFGRIAGGTGWIMLDPSIVIRQ